jgi:hypothetical protein
VGAGARLALREMAQRDHPAIARAVLRVRAGVTCRADRADAAADVVGDEDVVCPTDLGLEAFNRAREPKRLELCPGGHFSAYTDQFERAADAAAEWFAQHLRPAS